MSFILLDPKQPQGSKRQGRSALAIMAKAPRPGHVKTRLSPPLSPAEASDLNLCFLRDTSESLAAAASASSAALVLCYTPQGQEALFEGVLPAGFELLPQRGDNFGERLLHAAEDLFACGFSSVCLIDSDSPTVPAEAYGQALRELDDPAGRVVLGPAADGGYYLIGLSAPYAGLFEQVRWSTGTVYRDTVARARTLGLEVTDLPLWYDVDDRASLDVLRAELLAGIAPGFATLRGYHAPHTAKLLRSLNSAVQADKRLAPEAGGAADAAVDHRELPPAGMDEGR